MLKLNLFKDKFKLELTEKKNQVLKFDLTKLFDEIKKIQLNIWLPKFFHFKNFNLYLII